ncbi:hypothetical protein GCM10009105_06590 [Dokdonella soli]|uniref:Right handed beta helix domain-containing protein n=2 Tax=Dokdonella soli TaxID=529810 RepID=A0ABN1ICZ1_9GAMM
MSLGLLMGSLFTGREALADQTFCIDPGHTPTSLFSALQVWLNGVGEQINIKVVAGTFPIVVSMTQLNNNAASLVLLGGYKANTSCDDAQRNIKTNVSVLDGGGGGAFALEPNAPATIDGLTFSNFYGGTTQLGGVPVHGVYIYTVVSDVAMTRFIANHDDSIQVFNNNGSPNIAVQDCLVYNQPVNATLPAMRVGAENGNATVRNCTIAGNAAGGLQMNTYNGGQLNVYNTISFSNGGSDFSVGDVSNVPNVSFSFFSSGSGFNGFSNLGPPPSNYTLFAGPNDYHLAQSSPAINTGDPNLSYPPSETDLDGNLRVIGGRIDIGAYESNFVPNQYIVTNTRDDGSVGSLRWAIANANANPTTLSTIVFNLGTAAGCPYTITLGSLLPDIAAPVFIDARTHPGWVANNAIGAFNGTLCVEISNGANLNYALHTPTTASGSQLAAFGMLFAGFGSQAAIKLEGGSGHNIGGNAFGGPSQVANRVGVEVLGNSGGAQIGGADAAFENVFDNGLSGGIYLANAAGNNLVQNNLIGVAPDGVTPEGNGYGVFVSNSPNNTLRGNYIGYSTFATSGAIVLYGSASAGNQVQQNEIGWDFYGSMPSSGAGVVVSNGAHDNVIGNASFLTTSFGNIIRLSVGPGVWLTASAGNGNYVLGNDLIGNGGPTADNGLAIDLGGVGPDANTPLNPQNYPVLRSSFAMPNNQLVAGTLDAAPNTFYRIDFYHLNNAPLGSSGRGGAGLFSGAKGLVTDANGHCSFLLRVPQVQVGGWLSAATTPLSGNTSEIGNAVPDQIDGIFVDGFGGVDACQ